MSLSAPYREAEIRPESTPLRLSWWGLLMSLLWAACATALAYLLFRYVAKGWLGYAVAGVVALVALAFARGIGVAKVGTCPRCNATLDVGGSGPHGYPCPSCATYLDIDRGQLIVTPASRVAHRPRFAVESTSDLVFPDCCCICSGPTVKRVATKLGHRTFELPYCAKDAHGASRDSRTGALLFCSFPYATRVAEASGGKVVGHAKRTHGDSRWLGLGLAVLVGGMAAATYWGLAALDRNGYEIIPAGPRGLVLWIALKFLGRLWVTAILATIAAAFLGVFIGSFRPVRRGART